MARKLFTDKQTNKQGQKHNLPNFVGKSNNNNNNNNKKKKKIGKFSDCTFSAGDLISKTVEDHSIEAMAQCKKEKRGKSEEDCPLTTSSQAQQTMT